MDLIHMPHNLNRKLLKYNVLTVTCLQIIQIVYYIIKYILNVKVKISLKWNAPHKLYLHLKILSDDN